LENFLLHKRYVVENFCNTFKYITYKDMWGISLNCNTRKQELVWLDKELLEYQELSDCNTCTFINDSFVIIAYAQYGGNTNEENMGSCCNTVTNVTNIINNYSAKPIQFIVGTGDAPASGTVYYNNIDLIGFDLQIFLNGEGYLVENIDYIVLDTGGFQLLGGRLFNTGEVYSVFKIIS
jgi:hypothetical protein